MRILRASSRFARFENAISHIQAVANRYHGDRQKVAGIIQVAPIPAGEHDIFYANSVGACEIRVTASDIV